MTFLKRGTPLNGRAATFPKRGTPDPGQDFPSISQRVSETAATPDLPGIRKAKLSVTNPQSVDIQGSTPAPNFPLDGMFQSGIVPNGQNTLFAKEMKIVVRSLLVFVALSVVSAAALLAWLQTTGGTWRSDNIRNSSSLHSEINHYTNLEDLRKSLLKRIPVGSDQEIVEQFIAANFDDNAGREPNVPAARLLTMPYEDIACVRIFESGRISGGGWTECIFVFSASDKLLDIVVDQDGSWL